MHPGIPRKKSVSNCKEENQYSKFKVDSKIIERTGCLENSPNLRFYTNTITIKKKSCLITYRVTRIKWREKNHKMGETIIKWREKTIKLEF